MGPRGCLWLRAAPVQGQALPWRLLRHGDRWSSFCSRYLVCHGFSELYSYPIPLFWGFVRVCSMKMKRERKRGGAGKRKREKLAGNTAMSRSVNRERISLSESLSRLKKGDRHLFCILTLRQSAAHVTASLVSRSSPSETSIFQRET